MNAPTETHQRAVMAMIFATVELTFAHRRSDAVQLTTSGSRTDSLAGEKAEVV
jgi:hypothetical protein